MNYTHIIYKLVFPNNKVYIGQTKQEINRRLNSHKNIKKTYCNNYLYNAIKKYGWDNVNVEIICTILEEFVDDTERYFIKLHKSTDRNFGYNIEDGGKENYKLKDRTIKKIIAKMIGVKHTDERKIKASLRWVGEGNPKYNKNKKDEHPMWKKHHSDETKKKQRIAKLGKPNSKESIEKRANKNKKPIIMYDSCGNFMRTFESVKQATTESKISTHSILAVCKNKRQVTKGYIFKYAQKNNFVY